MNRNKRAGFTLVEIMIVVAIIGLLAAIAIPSLLKARTETQKKLIVNNLRLIEDGVDEVMTVSNLVPGSAVTRAMVGPFVKAGSITAMGWPNGFPEDTEITDAKLTAIAGGASNLTVVFNSETIGTGR